MTPPESLFRRLLGPAIDGLPPLVLAAHDGSGDQAWTGLAQVTGGKGLAATVVRRLMGFPRPGRDVPIGVEFQRTGRGERWRRRFGDHHLDSVLSLKDGLMIERMGPATGLFHVSVADGALHRRLVGIRFMGVPMPAWASPRCHAIEREEGGAFLFDVPIAMPGIGAVIRYRGRLERVR